MHEVPIRVEVHGAMPDDLPQLALTQVRSLLRIADGRVWSARMLLAVPAGEAGSARARVLVIVDGRPVLAQTTDETLRAAIDHMTARLRTRLVRMSMSWEERSGLRMSS